MEIIGPQSPRGQNREVSPLTLLLADQAAEHPGCTATGCRPLATPALFPSRPLGPMSSNLLQLLRIRVLGPAAVLPGQVLWADAREERKSP